MHTAGASSSAGGISIRFPRMTRIRDDKSWREATDVPRLEQLMSVSASESDWSEVLGGKALQQPVTYNNNNNNKSPKATKRPCPPESSDHPAPLETSGIAKAKSSRQQSPSTKQQQAVAATTTTTNNDNKNKKNKSMIKASARHLRTCLNGVTFHVSDNVTCLPDFKFLRRQIIACDGDLVGADPQAVTTDAFKQATHILLADDEAYNGSLPVMTVAQVKQRINSSH